VHRAAAPVLVAALLLTACGTGGSTGSDLPTLGASTTTVAPTTGAATTTTSTPAPDASPWTALPTISEGPNKGVHQGTVLASSVATTDDEKVAVETFMKFWSFLGLAGFEGRVDKNTLNSVATGNAAENLVQYVEALKADGHKTIGWDSVNVLEVSVGANGALLKACVDNGTFDVVAKTGGALEEPLVGYDINAGIRSGETWKVSTAQSTERTKPCAKR